MVKVKYYPVVNKKNGTFEVHSADNTILSEMDTMQAATSLAILCNLGYVHVDFHCGYFFIDNPIKGAIIDLDEQIDDFCALGGDEINSDDSPQDDEPELENRTLSKPISSYKEPTNDSAAATE